MAICCLCYFNSNVKNFTFIQNCNKTKIKQKAKPLKGFVQLGFDEYCLNNSRLWFGLDKNR